MAMAHTLQLLFLVLFLLPAGLSAQLTSNSPVCEGDNIVLTAPASADKYEWSGPGGLNQNTSVNTLSVPATTGATGTYFVTVYGSDTATYSTSVTVIERPPQPTISGDLNACDGDDLIIRSTNRGGSDIRWLDPSGGLFSNGSNLNLSNAKPSNSGEYTVVYSNAGCDGPELKFTITISPKPTQPSISGDNRFCLGDTVRLFGTSFGDVDSIVWTTPAGTGFSGTDLEIVDVTNAYEGTYFLEAWKSGCESTAAAITVDLVSPPVKPALDSGFEFCEDDQVVIQPTNAGGAAFVQWTPPSGPPFNSNQLSFDPVSTGDAGEYAVRYGNNTCLGPKTEFSLTVNPRPATPVLNFDPGSVLCSIDTVTISVQNPVASTYYFEAANGENHTGNDWQIAEPDTTYSGVLKAVAKSEKCQSDTVFATLTIKATPVITSVQTNAPVCKGDTLKVWVVTGSGSQIDWQDQAGNNYSGDTLVFPNQPYIPNLQFTPTASAGGCSVTGQTISTDVIRPIENLVINSNSPVCENDQFVLAAPPYDAVTYDWKGPHGFRMNRRDTLEVDVDLNRNGLFRVIASNICNTDTAFLDVVVWPIPHPEIDGDTAICVDDNEIAYLGVARGFEEYQWSTGSVEDSTEVFLPGLYTVRVWNQYGCSNIDRFQVLERCNASLFAPNAFTPNSDGDNDVFYMVGHNIASIRFEIFNHFGNTLFRGKSLYDGWDGTYRGNKVQDGIYFYRAVYTSYHKGDAFSEEVTGRIILLR